MSFLSDYIYYSSGNECPDEYLYWSGLSILGHVLGHKCWVEHGKGYFKFRPNIYVALVGDAGSGKNTALNINTEIMLKHFPDMLLSASIQSREDIALQMALDTTTNPLCYKLTNGALESYRSFYILNDELNNFLSVDKIKMMGFLIQVFDGKHFSTGFKKDRIENPNKKQWFSNPHVSLLAGAVPEWFMGNLKMDLFSSGMGRRMIIVPAKSAKVIPFPSTPIGADTAMGRVVEHLVEASKFSGGFELDDKAKEWWEPWYINHKSKFTTDPILAQFYSTMPMQVLKLALLLKCTERPFTGKIEADHLQASLELHEKLHPAIVKLTSGIGRNELAGISAQLIDFLDRTGGMQTERNVLMQFRRYANTSEFMDICNSLIKTGEIIVTANKEGKMGYFTPAGREAYLKMMEQKNQNSAPPDASRQ